MRDFAQVKYDGRITEEVAKTALDLMDETKELFLTSDLVKFAKMTVSDEENVKAVPTAVRFVTATWKEEEKVEEKEAENVL